MKKIIYLTFIFLFSCSANQDASESEIDFDDAFNDLDMSDSEKII